MSKMSFTFDARAGLEAYLPSLIELLGNQSISWSSINQKFTKEHLDRIRRYEANNNHLVIPASLYDIIGASLHGKEDALRLLDFFDKLLVEVRKHFSTQQLNKLRGTLYNILTNFDLRYLNFFGELAVLNNMLKAGYLLESVEFPLGNGNTADFKVKDKKGDYVLVEVLNIHPTKELSTDSEELDKFISGRINSKIAQKSKNGIANFWLVPVIWAQADELKKVYNFLKEGNKFSTTQSVEPCAFSCFTDVNGETIHKFGKISGLYDNSL